MTRGLFIGRSLLQGFAILIRARLLPERAIIIDNAPENDAFDDG